MSIAVLSVPDIICRQCEAILRAALQVIAGVLSVEVAIPEQTVIVEFDERLITTEGLVAAVEEEDYFVARSTLRAGSAE